MDWINIGFALVCIGSFIFSLYAHFKTESKKAIEAAKIAMHKERVRNVHFGIVKIINAIDAIVQLPKKGNATVEQLQDFARLARGESYLLARQLEMEEKQLKDWQFGKMVESNVEEMPIQTGKNNQS